jgi:hypothetical protein
MFGHFSGSRHSERKLYFQLHRQPPGASLSFRRLDHGSLGRERVISRAVVHLSGGRATSKRVERHFWSNQIKPMPRVGVEGNSPKGSS